MAIQIDEIRAIADRVAGSHHLDVVDVEFSGGGKFRTLRVFIEKDAEGRARLAEKAKAAAAGELGEDEEPLALPSGVPVEMLSGVTHEDCAEFAREFGTLLDVEDTIPGAEYTLEVSSPGLERKLKRAADFERFQGSLVKVQSFSPVVPGEGKATRQFQGRLAKFEGDVLTLDLSAVKQKGKKGKAAETQTVEIALLNVEKAQLIAEI